MVSIMINFIPNLIECSSFLVESSFVQIDYSNDYDLTLLLCELIAILKIILLWLIQWYKHYYILIMKN